MTVLKELKHLLHLDCMTVSGKTMGEEMEANKHSATNKVVRNLDHPIFDKLASPFIEFSDLQDGFDKPAASITQRSSSAKTTPYVNLKTINGIPPRSSGPEVRAKPSVESFPGLARYAAPLDQRNMAVLDAKQSSSGARI